MLLQIIFSQVGILDQVLQDISKNGVAYTIMLLVIVYLIYKLNSKEKENKELTDWIRNNEKENINILSQVNSTLDRVIEGQKTTNDMIFRELLNLKEFIRYFMENKNGNSKRKSN